jgi:hypothetical protein
MDYTDRAPVRARLRDALEVANTPFRFVQDGMRFPRSEERYRLRMDESFVRRPEPLIVYSAMKTATTAVARALEAADAFTVLKVHNIRPEHQYRGAGCALAAPTGVILHRAIEQRYAREYLARHPGRVRVLSLVRDPVAFAVSNFTYFGRAYWLRTVWRSAPWMPAEELGARFVAAMPPHAAEAWWRHEYAPTVGFDPVAADFDAEQGWSIRSCGRFEAMVLRADLPDDRKTDALRRWLPGAGIPEVARVNENSTQSPPVLADRLREFLRRTPAFVDRAMDLPMVRRFWTPAQRERMRAGWVA